MDIASYLIFGDLHGRILPAFRLASAWSREHGVAMFGLLQVGDLGYFPDPSRLDKATARFAAQDPLELGSQLGRRKRCQEPINFNNVSGLIPPDTFLLTRSCGIWTSPDVPHPSRYPLPER
jgi:hypothetical protein